MSVESLKLAWERAHLNLEGAAAQESAAWAAYCEAHKRAINEQRLTPRPAPPIDLAQWMPKT